jgi:putative flippase GtrA
LNAPDGIAGALAPTLVRGELPRILRFCIVGATNTAISLIVFVALVALGCPAPAASAIGFLVGAFNSYQLNRRWTFAGLERARAAGLRFTLLQGAGAAASAAGVFVLQQTGLGHLAAECVILPFVTAALYSVSRLLVFRSAAS